MTSVTGDQLDALLSPEGRALLAELAEQPHPADPLRLGTALRRRYPPDLVAAALTQHGLRAAAREKFRLADRMFFTRPGLEQASAEVVARHRAPRFAGRAPLADLCTGIGGDLIALAATGETLAVDRDPVHLRMARLNAEAYGLADRVRTAGTDVRHADLTGVAGVFVDPARRAADRRFRTGHSEPPLNWCLGLAGRVPAVGIKLAPGLDTALLPAGWEVEFLAVGRELREATAWSPALATTARRATVLPSGDSLTGHPGPAVAVAPPGGYLLDPSPAVTRAGLVEDLARITDTWKIDDRIAFLSADRLVRTPFARTLVVAESAPWREREIAARLRALDIGAIDIRRRGLAGDVEALHRRLALRGSRRATLVMTRVRDQPWALVCFDPPA